MTHPRRTFLRLAASAAALPAVSGFARAETYPSRPVRIIVGFAPGSSADIVARMLAPALSERLGQDVIVDNRTGTGGNLAAEAAVNATPDGYTLLMAGPSSAINATLYEKLGFNFARDIAPVTTVVESANVMVVRRSSAASSIPDFIALAKANPGTLTMASAGVGTAAHLAGEMFGMMTGVELVHTPYRGGAGAYDDLLAGRVDVYFPSFASSIDYIRAGRLCALGVTTPQRHPLLDVPSVGEFVPGYEVHTWFGIGAPRNTPHDIVDRLNADINATLADTRVAARIADLGATVVAGSPTRFGRLIADETARWAKVIGFTGTTTV
jgi:tripartite-type tricarboxylate transporter receptor subunit TctC